MALQLKYPRLPSFVVDNVSYLQCGNLRRPLPFIGINQGLAPEIQSQMQSPFVEAFFYGVKSLAPGELEDKIKNNDLLYYVSTGNFKNGVNSRSSFIKSFTMGASQAHGATLEIIDTSGLDFLLFYNKMFSGSCNGKVQNDGKEPDYNVHVVSINVGYVFTNSDGLKYIYQGKVPIGLPDKTIGPYINFQILKIELSYEANCPKYKLTLKGPDIGANQVKVNNRFGKPGQPIPLLEAAELMLDGSCPPRKNGAKGNARVVLVKPPQGAAGQWSYVSEEGATLDANETRKGVYAGYNLPPLDAIRKNLDTFLTQNGNGVFMCFPTGANDDALYLVEAESIFCDEKSRIIPGCNFSGNFLGTYVINGGDLSPVISFNPKIEFVGTPNKVQGGAAGGSMAPKAQTVANGCADPAGSPTDKKDNNDQGQEVAVKSAIDQNKLNGEVHPRELPTLAAKAAEANMSAYVSSKPIFGTITAELKIQGDPRFLFTLNWLGCSIKIIFVNPFAIGETPFVLADQKVDWLATPAINSQISKGLYFVKACDHEVGDGKWTTTLSLVQNPT